MEKGKRSRENRFGFYLSDNENEVFMEKFKASNYNDKSTFIRKLIIDGYVISYDFKGLKELINEINKIGVNINQIAKYVNEYGGAYDKQDISEIKNYIENIQNMIVQKFVN